MKKTILSLLVAIGLIGRVLAQITSTNILAVPLPLMPAPSGGNDFNTIISQNFKYWKNSNGVINESVLNALMTNTSLTTYQSLAVSAIKRYAFSEAGGNQYNEFLAISFPNLSSLTNTNGVIGDALIRRYNLLYKNYAYYNTALFANNLPTFQKIHQGAGGDCYLLSIIGAMAHRNPTDIKNLVTWSPGGYTVTFPTNWSRNYKMNKKQIFISAPTLCETLTYNSTPLNQQFSSTSVADGIWLPVLQKATGIVLQNTNQYPIPNGSYYAKPVENNPEPMDYIFIGGAPDYMMALYTGNDVIASDLNPGLYPNIALKKQKLISELSYCTSNNRLMEMCITKLTFYNSPNKLPQNQLQKLSDLGLYTGHCYSVLGYNSTNQMVTLWNPFGNNISVSGVQNLTNGYNMTNGVFQMSLDTIINQINGAFCFERQSADPNLLQ